MVRDRQPMLDVVRGVAILLVLLFHLRLATGLASVDRLLEPLLDAGWMGVDLFFVLSGYLVGRLILAEAATPAGLDLGRFYLRRALRLWPVLYLYLGALLVLGGSEALGLVLPVIFHVQNYATHIPSHLWSLAVEEHFYLVAGLALPPLLRRGGPRAVAGVLLALLAGCLALRVGALFGGESLDHLQWRTQYRADAIAAGVLIAWAERWRPDVLAAASRHRGACLGVALAGAAVLAAFADLRWRYTAGLTVAWIAGAAVVLAGRGVTPSIRRSSVAQPLAWLGGISYPLYIWHVSAGRVADALTPGLGLHWLPGVLAWRYAVAIGLAALIAAWIERPLMRLRDLPGSPSARGSPLLLLRTNRSKVAG